MSSVRPLLDLIDALDDLVRDAKAVPMTDQVRVDKEKIYDLLDGIRAALPAAVQRPEPPPPLPAASGTPLAPPREIDIESPDKLLASLDALDELVQNAKRVPLSDDRRIDAERFYKLIERARADVPEAIKAAKWLFVEYRRAWSSPQGTGMADVDLNLDLGLDEPSG
jgi:hypothetical protein